MSSYIVDVHGMKISLGGKPIIQGIDFQLMKGKSILLVGDNGAGKSTLLRALFGLIPVSSGSVEVCGQNVITSDPRDLITAGVRFLSQENRCFDSLKVKSQRAALSKLYGYTRSSFDIVDSTVDPNAKMSGLSLGERKLEALNMLGVGSPKLFMLDEPQAGIDAIWRMRVCEKISEFQKQLGSAFIIVEHEYQEIINMVDFVGVFEEGSINITNKSEFLKNQGLVL